ncbi:hypothetical protein AMS68_005771 [Peltaster fructicola]|uniref:Uncharacterized protein n=1 Tax=Peltaster fructicola TaxID=286661 RepID=A0A6H0XZT7_9PEZI|nr:hypothetical protein AMS68_005771 [Peltaster fructicola]
MDDKHAAAPDTITKEVQVPEWEHTAAHGPLAATTTRTSILSRFSAKYKAAVFSVSSFLGSSGSGRRRCGMTRRTLLLVVLAVFLIVVAIIIGLAVGLTRKQGSSGTSNLPLPGNTQTFSGELTYYGTGLGACGITSSDDDNIVAVSHIIFDAAGSSSSTGGNSNSNPLCNRTLRATRYDSAVGQQRSVDLTFITSKTDLPSPSQTPFSRHSQSLSLALESIQPRASSHTARDRDGQKSSAISPQRRSHSGSRHRRETWWLPASEASTPELPGPGGQAGLIQIPNRAMLETFMETPVTATLGSASRRDSADSTASSVAYIAHNRRQDFRLMQAPAVSTKDEELIQLERELRGRPRNISRKSTKPTIVEDSQDYITSKPLPKTTASHPASTSLSPVCTPSSTRDSSLPTSSSSATVSANKRVRSRGQRRTESDISVPKVKSDSTSTLVEVRARKKRPGMSRYHTSDNITPRRTVHSMSTSASLEYGYPRLPAFSNILGERNIPWSTPPVSTPADTMHSSVIEQDSLPPLPSFQPDEQYFEVIKTQEQRKFTPSITPERMSQTVVNEAKRPASLMAKSPFHPSSVSNRPLAPGRRKCRCCFVCLGWKSSFARTTRHSPEQS